MMLQGEERETAAPLSKGVAPQQQLERLEIVWLTRQAV